MLKDLGITVIAPLVAGQIIQFVLPKVVAWLQVMWSTLLLLQVLCGCGLAVCVYLSEPCFSMIIGGYPLCCMLAVPAEAHQLWQGLQCHDSAARIPFLFKHIQQQGMESNIDNASRCLHN